MLTGSWILAVLDDNISWMIMSKRFAKTNNDNNAQ